MACLYCFVTLGWNGEMVSFLLAPESDRLAQVPALAEIPAKASGKRFGLASK